MKKHYFIFTPVFMLIAILSLSLMGCGNKQSQTSENADVASLDSDTVITDVAKSETAVAVSDSASIPEGVASYGISDDDSQEEEAEETSEESESESEEEEFVVSVCPTCHGTCLTPNTNRYCKSCGGTGTVRMYNTKDGGVRINSGNTHIQVCNTCFGAGRLPNSSTTCPECGGSGSFLIYD